MPAHGPLVGHVAGVGLPLVGRRSVPSHTPLGHDSTNGLKAKHQHRGVGSFNVSRYDYILNPSYDAPFAPGFLIYHPARWLMTLRLSDIHHWSLLAYIVFT